VSEPQAYRLGRWKCELPECVDGSPHHHSTAFLIGELLAVRAQLAAKDAEISRLRAALGEREKVVEAAIAYSDATKHHRIKRRRLYCAVQEYKALAALSAPGGVGE